MSIVKFAYDGVINKQLTVPRFSSYNIYDKCHYPINGPFDYCYYDYHAPLQTVFNKAGITTQAISVTDSFKHKDKFVYMMTFRYLYSCIIESNFDIDKHFNVFKHLPVGIIQAINSNQCIFVLNDGHENAFYDENFYTMLLSKLTDVGIDPSKVILITGNANNNTQNVPITLIFWQYFETAVRMSTEKIQIDDNRFLNSDRIKKFLCLNRQPREHRYFFAYEMLRRNLLDQFSFSLKHVNNIDEITSNDDNIFLNSVKNTDMFKSMLLKLPWIVDVENFEFNHWGTHDSKLWCDNLIYIVTETLLAGGSGNMFLTEKTFKPIAYKMPFIIIGQDGILKYLKVLGYKTFSDYWDESYDDELNLVVKMQKTCDLVESLAKMNNNEMIKMIKSMSDILNHNYDLFKRRRAENSIINAIKERL